MHLITIGREFGSGGREVGKRLAGLLGWDYYDREVLAALAGESALSERYVERALENGAWRGVPLTFRRSFRLTAPPAGAGLLSGERRIIEGVAALGRDAVIVGRSADVLLAEYRPLRLFLRADAAAKLRRCRERAEPGAAPSDAEILRAMRRIDRSRRENRSLVTETPWGDPASYDLILNTTGQEPRLLAEALAAYARAYFGGES